VEDLQQLTDTLDKNDPGDETLRRFRYQITYAAILAIYITDDRHGLSEIYCEHHEDVLVKHVDDTLTGVQIKTKDINLPPFNIEDEAIKNCLRKFVCLNRDHAVKFRGFSIVSNHGFDKTKPAICLNTLIDNVKNGVNVLQPKTKTKALVTWLEKECNCTPDCVLDTIKKIKLRTYCALDDIQMKLTNEIKLCNSLKGLTESKISDIAEKLIMKAFNASSLLPQDEQISVKYVLGIASIEDDNAAIIDSKRIRKADIVPWFENERTQPATILLKDKVPIPQATNGHQLLQLKMDAGGIDSENIDLVRDFKFAFEQHALGWLYKASPDEAEAKYNQILLVTQNLCKEVYDEQKVSSKTDPGLPMLIEVRKRIGNRQKADSKIFVDCSYEHVLGAVGVLTENCKVWWSAKFKIKG
jgi:hypothetical protein